MRVEYGSLRNLLYKGNWLYDLLNYPDVIIKNESKQLQKKSMKERRIGVFLLQKVTKDIRKIVIKNGIISPLEIFCKAIFLCLKMQT